MVCQQCHHLGRVKPAKTKVLLLLRVAGYRCNHGASVFGQGSKLKSLEQFSARSVSTTLSAECTRLSPYLHPEFGGFCPSSRLRRDLRIVVFSVLFGVTAGAAGMISLTASHSPATPNAVEVVSSGITDKDVSKETRSDLAGASNGQASGVGIDPRVVSSQEVGEAKRSTSACSGATSGRDCSFFKQRSVRVRAINDGPATARVAFGRTAASPADATPDTPAALPSSSSSPIQALGQTRRRASMQKSAEDRSQSIQPGPLKTKQKTAKRERRERSEPGNDYSGPADPWGARAESNDGSRESSRIRGKPPTAAEDFGVGPGEEGVSVGRYQRPQGLGLGLLPRNPRISMSSQRPPHVRRPRPLQEIDVILICCGRPRNADEVECSSSSAHFSLFSLVTLWPARPIGGGSCLFSCFDGQTGQVDIRYSHENPHRDGGLGPRFGGLIDRL